MQSDTSIKILKHNGEQYISIRDMAIVLAAHKKALDEMPMSQEAKKQCGHLLATLIQMLGHTQFIG